MSTVTKCDICGAQGDEIGELILYTPELKRRMDICESCRRKYTVTEAFVKRKKE